MSIKQDDKTGIWQIDFSVNGQRVQKSSGTKTKKLAQELHDKLKLEAWRQVNVGDAPKATWSDLCDAWHTAKKKDDKRSIKDDLDKLRWLTPLIGENKLLTEIDGKFIAEILDTKMKQGNVKILNDGGKRVRPLANATINRYGSLIHSMMELARAKEWVTTVPPVGKLKEVKERISYLTQEQAVRLLNELPKHLVPLVRFSLATGLRQANVMQLEWANVDIERKIAWVWSDEFKGKSDHSIPLNDDAIEILKAQKERKRSKYVFANDSGLPYNYPAGKAWKSALKRAEIAEGFRWHDLRHTWATWHVMNGTPLEVLMKLGGWKSIAMVLKYAHLSQSHLLHHASNIRLPQITSISAPLQATAQKNSEDSATL